MVVMVVVAAVGDDNEAGHHNQYGNNISTKPTIHNQIGIFTVPRQGCEITDL